MSEFTVSSTGENEHGKFNKGELVFFGDSDLACVEGFVQVGIDVFMLARVGTSCNQVRASAFASTWSLQNGLSLVPQTSECIV